MKLYNIILFLIIFSFYNNIIYCSLENYININDPKYFFPKKNNIIFLNENLFYEIIKVFPRISIFFYTETLEYNNEVLNEMILATKDKEFSLFKLNFAKINVENYKFLSKSLGIRKVPTILNFENGVLIDEFKGEFTKKELLNYYYKKYVNPLKLVNNLDTLKNEYENTDDIKLIYFGNDKEKIKFLNKFSLKDNKHIFGIVNDKKLLNNYKYSKIEQIALFKPYDDKIQYLKDFNENNLKDFILNNSFPFIIDIKNGIEKINDNQPVLIYIRENSNNLYDNIVKNVSIKYHKKIYFLISDIKGKYESILIKKFNFNPNELKNNFKLFITENNTNYFYNKFNNKSNNILNEISLSNFISDYIISKYVPGLMSAEIPLNQDQIVYQLVEKNFKKEVLENDLDVFVKFYKPTCIHCAKIKEDWEMTAKFFEKYKEKVRIAEFNLLYNNIKYISIKSWPTMYLFKKGEKGIPMKFEGIRNKENFINFVLNNMNNKLDIKYSENNNLNEEKNNNKNNLDLNITNNNTINDDFLNPQKPKLKRRKGVNDTKKNTRVYTLEEIEIKNIKNENNNSGIINVKENNAELI